MVPNDLILIRAGGHLTDEYNIIANVYNKLHTGSQNK